MCWCWQFSWFSQRWKIIACGVAAGIVCVFVASTPTPIRRQSFGSGAHFKACVKLYVMLIKMEGSRVNWQSPATASAKWHTEKCLATNGRAEFYLSNMQACERKGDSGHLCVHSHGASRVLQQLLCSSGILTGKRACSLSFSFKQQQQQNPYGNNSLHDTVFQCAIPT